MKIIDHNHLPPVTTATCPMCKGDALERADDVAAVFRRALEDDFEGMERVLRSLPDAALLNLAATGAMLSSVAELLLGERINAERAKARAAADADS